MKPDLRSHRAGTRRTAVAAITVLASLLVNACSGGQVKPNGPFAYTRSEVAWLVGGSGQYQVLVTQSRQIWIADNGSGRLRTDRHEIRYFGPNDKQEWASQGYALGVEDEVFDAGRLGTTDLSTLPTSVEALRARILSEGRASSGGKRSDAWIIHRGVRDYLWESLPSGDLKRALFDLLMATPGIEHQDARDRASRPGVAFTITSDSRPRIRQTVILSDSGDFLGEETELLDKNPSIDHDPPVVIGYGTYLANQQVQSLDDEP